MNLLISPAEPAALKAIGEASSIPETVGCDFVWGAHGKLIGVQRKEFNDLLSSSEDARLAKEMGQMGRLHIAYLIVEGDGLWTSSGQLADPYRRRWTRSGVRRLLLSVAAQSVTVLHSRDITDTLATLADLYEWSQKKEHLALVRRGAPPASSWGTRGSEQYKHWVVQGLPHMGPKKAAALLEHFGGELPIQWKCTKEELAAIPGFGKKTVEDLWAVLEPQLDAAGAADSDPALSSELTATPPDPLVPARRKKKVPRLDSPAAP